MGADMKTRRPTISLVLAAMIAMTSLPASAQMTDGQVVKVDQSAGKITIKHGPLKKFDMDEGMTMVYRVEDPAMLGSVKAGDKIKFDADRINGQFTVTRIQK
jgi:Cu(I)/Ag(I) efflux system periplasmic protein CusF